MNQDREVEVRLKVEPGVGVKLEIDAVGVEVEAKNEKETRHLQQAVVINIDPIVKLLVRGLGRIRERNEESTSTKNPLGMTAKSVDITNGNIATVTMIITTRKIRHSIKINPSFLLLLLLLSNN